MTRTHAPEKERGVPRPASRTPSVGVGLVGFVALIGLLVTASPVVSQESPPPRPAEVAPDGPAQNGRIEGTVRDAETGEPVVGALVRVREVGRSDLSHADGSFHLENLNPGRYDLVVQMLGYASLDHTVTVLDGETTPVDFELVPSAIPLAGIVVTGLGRERGVAETYRPTAVLAGRELDRRLSRSLAETLRHQQGLAMRSFGPAPAQPVVRGMGGDRVLVLEDGQRTGDLYSTGPDHAVGIDPVSAQRIEVVRGPAAVLYGSNALGGVINVIREEIPRSLPERVESTASLQGESVSRGVTGAGTLLVPRGPDYAFRAEASARRGGDIRTPYGDLEPTDSQGYNAQAGASWLPSWGFVGASYRIYALDHGIPGEFRGEAIPGAHPGGANAETRRQVGRVQLGHFGGLGPFRSVQAEAGLIHYVHEEIEGVLETGERVVGTSFDQITATLNAVGRHQHEPGELQVEGAVGVFASYRDLLTGGAFPGVRDAREVNLAAYAFEEFAWNRYQLQAGLRFDWDRSEPVDTRPIEAGDGEFVPIRTRSFGDVSGSVAALVELRPGWILGASVARASRTPSVQELFSGGPHLADFSYDIGNPDLGTEVGYGTDLFLRISRPRLNLEATLFENRVRDFIHYRPTGAIDPRLRRFPVFVADQADAVFRGVDGGIQAEILPNLIVDGSASYVRAHHVDSGEPLPLIPPLNATARVRYEVGSYFISAGWEGAAPQNRVPHPIQLDPDEPEIRPELPTDGYHLFEAGVGLRWFEGERTHSITFGVENLFDTVWRNHLSRAKDVAPEPGRNFQLLYRISF